jgi:hypothetical protein
LGHLSHLVDVDYSTSSENAFYLFSFDTDDRPQERLNQFSTMPNNHLTAVTNGIRPSSSSPMVAANGNHPVAPNNVAHSMNNGNHTIRNAFSHNPLNLLER